MKIVVACDSFKECLPGWRVAELLAEGLHAVRPDARVVQVPMADGGQGTVEAVVRATGGTRHEAIVHDALGRARTGLFGVTGDGRTAVVEMAASAGLEHVAPADRDVMAASTFGTGELLLAAADRADEILLGIGGSATNDGGAGMATALGFRLLDEAGKPLPPGGGPLGRLHRIERPEQDRLVGKRIAVACDVTNPLTGPQGASAVYGPQKGATAAQVEILDRNLTRFADIVGRDLHRSVAAVAGAGAAGGLGAGLLAFTDATLGRGVELVADAVGLAGHLRGADLCITGEGAIDGQSAFGKTAVGVARIAARQGVRTVAVCGTLRDGHEAVHEAGIAAVLPIVDRPMTPAEAMRRTPENLVRIAAQIMRLLW